MSTLSLTLLFVLVATLQLVQCADIVVIGDSWGSSGYGQIPFANVMKKHNVTVDNIAVSGSTSNDWAAQPNKLRDTVRKNPDAKLVWLTIGGNDAKNELPFGKSVSELVAELTERTQTFLDPLFEDNKDITVVQFGYDIVTFSKGLVCPIFGAAIFPACGGNITCVNTEFIRLQHEYVEGLSKIYPGRHVSVNLLGTLQAVAGIPDASTGHPNLDYYTPDYLMQSNCIHPTSAGFTDVFNKFWDVYLSSVFETQDGFQAQQ